MLTFNKNNTKASLNKFIYMWFYLEILLLISKNVKQIIEIKRFIALI